MFNVAQNPENNAKIVLPANKKKGFLIARLATLITQLPGRLFSPSDICQKLSHYFSLHFPIGMGSYDNHEKY